MKLKKIGLLLGAIFVMFATVVCSASNITSLGATATPEPTSTPRPTATLQPTATPSTISQGEWADGHFWSIKVANVETKTELDDKTPLNDIFVLVDVQWKANHLNELHQMAGIDYMLVDNSGEEYTSSGMIYESKTFESFSTKAEYQKGKWRVSRVRGTHDDTYRMVFDLPASAQGLKLWFRDYPLIDLDM